jgi:hypothetical protein
MKKSQKDLIKDAFTKTIDQRYQEMSKFEKFGYWFCIGATCAFIFGLSFF